jgi:multiple sugar transport system substrate-binding protein
MKRRLSWISLLLVVSLILAACGGGGAAPAPTTAPAEAPTEAPTEAPVEAPAEEATEAPAEEAAAEEEATEEPAAGGEETTGAVTFVSTQFTPIEEQEKFRAILQQAGFDFTASEEGPFLDHGARNFPTAPAG